MSNAMQDSGIVWIGEIPSHWNLEKLRHILHERIEKNEPIQSTNILSLTAKQGVVPLSEKEGGGNKPKEDVSQYKLAYPDDIVMNSMNILSGAVGISKYKGCVSPVYYVLLPNTKDISPFYYNYLFQTPHFQSSLRGLGNGILIKETEKGTLNTIRMRIPMEKLRNQFLPQPSYEEQIAIVDYLDIKIKELDKVIVLQEQMIEELKAYRQSKIKEMFDCYMQKEHFYYSKLGALSSLITKQTGFDYSNTISPALVEESSDSTIPYLQTKHFKDGYWNYNTDYYIPKDVACKFPKILLNKKCLLFSIVGASIGNVAVFPATQTAFLGGAICKVDLLEEQNYEYVKHYMMSYYGQEQITARINSSAQGTITVQNVRDFKIPIFENVQVQDKITKEIGFLSETISSLIQSKQFKIEELKEYKKSIIYECVTGKKDVI